VAQGGQPDIELDVIHRYGAPVLKRIRRLAGAGSVVLLGAVIIQEMRRPPDQREWHGTLAGVVPYDLRPPTAERLRQGLLNPHTDALFVPQVFGIGWTLNFGRAMRSLREGSRQA
jgi:hypothetical protein